MRFWEGLSARSPRSFALRGRHKLLPLGFVWIGGQISMMKEDQATLSELRGRQDCQTREHCNSVDAVVDQIRHNASVLTSCVLDELIPKRDYRYPRI